MRGEASAAIFRMPINTEPHKIMSYSHTKRRKTISKLKRHFPKDWRQILQENGKQIRNEQAGIQYCRTNPIKGSVGASTPALNKHQAARALKLSPDHVLILVRARLLHPKGRPQAGPRILIPIDELLHVANDPVWLAKAHRAVRAYWDQKMAKRLARKEPTNRVR
jgi:hypothetical protein